MRSEAVFHLSVKEIEQVQLYVLYNYNYPLPDI